MNSCLRPPRRRPAGCVCFSACHRGRRLLVPLARGTGRGRAGSRLRPGRQDPRRRRMIYRALRCQGLWGRKNGEEGGGDQGIPTVSSRRARRQPSVAGQESEAGRVESASAQQAGRVGLEQQRVEGWPTGRGGRGRRRTAADDVASGSAPFERLPGTASRPAASLHEGRRLVAITGPATPRELRSGARG